jgi:Ca-activated chloride channel family protein
VRSSLLFAIAGFSSLSLALVAPLLPLHQGRDEDPFTIAVDADLVVFNVTVTDNKGRPVAGLKAGDFQVREDNRLESIRSFNAEDGPASIGLIIDNSGSMRDKHTDVARAALGFVNASNAEDEIFVVTFNEKVFFGLPPTISFTSDLDEIHAALIRNPPNGMTALYDAIAAGVEHLKYGSRDHKALVVLSDGGDNASRQRLEDLQQILRRSSATIFTIGIYDDTDVDRNPRVLRRIAKSSNGKAFFPGSLREMDTVWRDIAVRIRSQYTIGYHSSNPNRDGKFRTVKITASRGNSGNLSVSTRPGYPGPSDPVAK